MFLSVIFSRVFIFFYFSLCVWEVEKDFCFGVAASDSVYWRIFVSFVLGGKGSVYAAVLCLPAAVLRMGVWLADKKKG